MSPAHDRRTSFHDWFNEQTIPIPIQTFLWQQTTPFIRPKLGKLHEASCTFCQNAPGHHEMKEACKAFEKVLVQNITSGLSKELLDAIKSIPRWRLVQASFAHVIHCSAALLHNRKDTNLQTLGAAESKLLYILHWILLDAAEECADADYEKGAYHTSPFYYLFSIPSITLFIYMFAPLCHHIKESDLQTFRLENGLKVWQALWDYRHPEAPCFTAPCKPKPKVVWSKILKQPHHNSQFGDIFLGRKHSDGIDGLLGSGPGPGSPPSHQGYVDPCSVSVGGGKSSTPLDDDPGAWPGALSSPKDLNFPETIPEESSSVEEEHVMIYRLPSISENDKPNRIYKAHPNSIFRMTVEKEKDNGGYPPKASLTIEQVTPTSETSKSHGLPESHSRSDLHRVTSQTSPPLASTKDSKPHTAEKERDMNSATFMDVAVLRCLFISQWPEEGVYWALQFIYHRLRDLNEEKVCQQQPRRRSNSLPIPKIEVSLYQSPEMKLGNLGTRGGKELMDIPEQCRDSSLLSESPFYLRKAGVPPDEICSHFRRFNERARKKLKMTDFRAYVEAKILSKSERNLLQASTEDIKTASRLSLNTRDDTGGLKCTRSNATSLARLVGQDSDEPPCSNLLVKGNSMPSLRIGEERREGDFHYPRPIITVTQHTPMPSPEFNLCPKGSIDSQLDTLSQPGGGRCSQNSRHASLTRSHTDSNITYSSSESDVTEAPSSTPYITRDGELDLRVVLMALHDVAHRNHISATLRVCEVILNVLELIIDLGVLRMSPREDVFTLCTEGGRTPSPAFLDTVLSRPISIVINTVVRVLRHLGCPHGCGDGQRGPPGNFLRSQATGLLTKLKRVNPKLFSKFLKNMVQKYTLNEVLEFYHAYVGFCVDPTSLLSPLNQKRGCTKSPDTLSQGGYATNFGQSIGGSSGGSRGGVEGQIFSSTFKALVTRLIKSAKELKTPENMSMYHDVRQLMQYVKESHGGTFRRVVLSGLIDTAIKPHRKEPDIQTTRVVRHVPQTEQDDTIESSSPCYIVEERDNKKSLFKKRSTSSTCASLLDTDVTDDYGKPMQSPLGNLRKKQHSHILTPRQSERNIGVPEHIIKGSKFGGIVSWFKKESGRSDSFDSHDGSDSPVESALVHQAAARLHHSYSKASQHSGSSGGHTVLNKAKRRVEDQLSKFGFGKRKRKDGSIEETPGSYFSRRNSDEFGSHGRDSEFVVLKERRLVPIKPLFEGMQRFSFLLETCHPGSVPDGLLIGASLDLPNTPVISRAAFLLECCYFVHCCNKGTWPAWMKLNVPMFRPSGPLTGRGSTAPTGIRRSQFLQKSAGKMFFQWAEALGVRLEELLAEDRQHIPEVINMMSDDTKQKELLIDDEEEDFLDEAIENPYGADCPIPLRMIACILLLEITAFLRETYQTLPKTSRHPRGTMGPAFAPWEKFCPRTDRRCSVALSSMGYSQTSAQSLQSIADKDSAAQGERKISFVLHEPDNESEESSNNTCHNEDPSPLPSVDDKNKKKGAPAPLPITTPQGGQGRPILLRRGTTTTGVPSTGSFKRRSLKLRRGTKEAIVKESPNEYPDFKRTDSLQSKRKVSSISDRSDTSEHADVVSGEESPGILSDDQPPESPSDSNDTDELSTSHLPWMKTMVQVAASFNFYCSHQSFCHPFCYRRNMRACTRLVKAVRKVYGEEFGVVGSLDSKLISSDLFKKDIKCKSHKMSEHSSSQASPIKRKDSVSKKDRIDKNTVDGSSSKDSTKDGELTDDNKQTNKSKKQEDKVKDSHPILKYLKTQVRDVFHAPIATLIKGAVVLTEDQFSDILPIAWELLLESNQELVATGAALFIVASVRAPSQASDLMQYHLQHQEAAVRISAIQRFQILWKLRYQVWPRMEDTAHVTFKVPPPGIEFTLPSPKIGSESLPVVDPPWMPQVKTKVDEVQLSQESHKRLVTATKTRKKQQTELIKLAMQQREDKNRNEREHFLITTIPITKEAAYDPVSLHAVGDTDHDEMGDEEQAETGQAPPPTQPQTPGSTRNQPSHHISSATALFPSSLCSSVITIINLLNDAAVSNDGIAVYDVAYQVIWNCLVEESSLFLRYILERLTREKQDVMFKVLRHLIRFVPKLPQQAAFALYNYIIGYVMFYVRSPHGEGQRMIGAGLSILWMVVHSVNGIMFKDLKQILRKEQCDASILLTANVPSTKKIIVHGPQDMDDVGIPSQFPVQEETQFLAILREALDFFGIDEEKHGEYFLVDHKTRQIHNPVSYVRDYYFFKRSQYPQLKLVHLNADEAFNALQQQELLHKFIEIGKVLLTWAILKNVDMVVQRVVFLHEELMKLPSFPRKALDTDLDLYKGGIMGKELLGLDVLHKFMWVRLIARMFEAMAGNFAYSGDIHLFLNVLNGAVTLHSEDACILRYVMATYINAAHNFKNIFSTNGYLLIIPSLLQLYASHQTNKLVTRTVEYTVKQFYLMNRKPFILQMFGAASAILDTDDNSQFGDAHKVPARCLFNLLLSLETPSPDPLNIGELVKEEKPLKAIDFCYHDENEMVTVLDCISLCVMVVAYAAESTRAYQMLVILEAILPCYLKQIQCPMYTREGKTEREIINQLAVTVKTLVNNCEALAKNYSGPTLRQSPEHKGSSQRNCSRGGPYSPGFDFDEDSHSKYMADRKCNKNAGDIEEMGRLRAEWRRPRDVLLNLVAEFVTTCNARLIDLNKRFPQEGKSVELLDLRSNIRLADVAHSLLKVAPYDPATMGCRGLQNYMTSLMPATEWSTEALKPTLLMLLRRQEKTFVKIFKKSECRRHTDWEAASGLVRGIYETLSRHPYLVQLQPLRVVITTCQSLIIGELGTSGGATTENCSSSVHALMTQVPPPHFCASVVRLIALQIIAMEFCYHQDSFTLEHVCGNTTVFVSPEKTESMLMNFLMPLCLRVGSGRKEINCMRQGDILFTLTCVLNAILPPITKTAIPVVNQNLKTEIRTGSVTFTARSDVKSLYQVGFLALKIVIVCFESELTLHWPRIARTIKEVNKMNEARLFLWNFLEFVVGQRSPLYVLLQPFIHQKLLQTPYSDPERHHQFIIREKMFGLSIPKCRAALLTELITEMKTLKEELEDKKYAEQCNQKNTNLDQHTTAIEITAPRSYHRPSIIDLLTGSHPPAPIPVVPSRPVGVPHGLDPSQNGGSHRESVSSLQDVNTYLQNFTNNNNALNNNLSQSDNDTTADANDNVENLSPCEEELPHELVRGKSKLQRTKAQSKKTFRMRKSRKEAQRLNPSSLSAQSTPRHTPGGGTGTDISSAGSEQDLNGNQETSDQLGNMDSTIGSNTEPPLSNQNNVESTLGSNLGHADCHHGYQDATPLARSPLSVHDSESVLTNGNAPPSWGDEDLSLMSQTSSTSGYRENCSLLMMPTFETCSSPPSPEGTQRFYPSTSTSTVVQVDNISEHSLIISYQHHDEDSLI
uniref:Protein unc-80 homolog n=1 Tax=Cacopsylla melanoneura TaxID=428564 RepID=A0A8D9ERC4_9HEMI